MNQRINRILSLSEDLCLRTLSKRRKAYETIGKEMQSDDFRRYLSSEVTYRERVNTFLATVIGRTVVFLINEFKRFKQKGTLDICIKNETGFLLSRLFSVVVHSPDSGLQLCFIDPVVIKKTVEHTILTLELVLTEADCDKLVEGYVSTLIEFFSSREHVERCLSTKMLKKMVLVIEKVIQYVCVLNVYTGIRVADLIFYFLTSLNFQFGGNNVENRMMLTLTNCFQIETYGNATNGDTNMLTLRVKIVESLTGYIQTHGIYKGYVYRVFFEDVVTYCFTNVSDRHALICFNFLRTLISVSLAHMKYFNISGDIILHIDDELLLRPQLQFTKLITLDLSILNNPEGYIEFIRLLVDLVLLLAVARDHEAILFFSHCLAIIKGQGKQNKKYSRAINSKQFCLRFIFFLLSSSNRLLQDFLKKHCKDFLVEILSWCASFLGDFKISKNLIQERKNDITPYTLPIDSIYWCFYIVRIVSLRIFEEKQRLVHHEKGKSLLGRIVSLIHNKIWGEFSAYYSISSHSDDSTSSNNLSVILESVRALCCIFGVGVLDVEEYSLVMLSVQTFVSLDDSNVEMSVEWLHMLVLIVVRGQVFLNKQVVLSRTRLGNILQERAFGSISTNLCPLFVVGLLAIYFPNVCVDFKLSCTHLYLLDDLMHFRKETDSSMPTILAGKGAPLDKNFCSSALQESLYSSLAESLRVYGQHIEHGKVMNNFLSVLTMFAKVSNLVVSNEPRLIFDRFFVSMAEHMFNAVFHEITTNYRLSCETLWLLWFYKKNYMNVFKSDSFVTLVEQLDATELLASLEKSSFQKQDGEDIFDNNFEISGSTQINGESIYSEAVSGSARYSFFYLIESEVQYPNKVEFPILKPVVTVFSMDRFSGATIDLVFPKMFDQEYALLNFCEFLLICFREIPGFKREFNIDDLDWICKFVFVKVTPTSTELLYAYVKLLMKVNDLLSLYQIELDVQSKKQLASTLRPSFFLYIKKPENIIIKEKLKLRLEQKVMSGVYLPGPLREIILGMYAKFSNRLKGTRLGYQIGQLLQCSINDRDLSIRLISCRLEANHLTFDKIVECCLSSSSLYLLLGPLTNSYTIYHGELSETLGTDDCEFSMFLLLFEMELLVEMLSSLQIKNLKLPLVYIILFSMGFLLGTEFEAENVENKKYLQSLTNFHVNLASSFLNKLVSSNRVNSWLGIIFSKRFDVIHLLSKLSFNLSPSLFYGDIIGMEENFKTTSTYISELNLIPGVLGRRLNQLLIDFRRMINGSICSNLAVPGFLQLHTKDSVCTSVSEWNISVTDLLDLIKIYDSVCFKVGVKKLTSINVRLGLSTHINILDIIRCSHPVLVLSTLSNPCYCDSFFVNAVEHIYFKRKVGVSTSFVLLLSALKLLEKNKTNFSLQLITSLVNALEGNQVEKQNSVYSIFVFFALIVVSKCRHLDSTKRNSFTQIWRNSNLYFGTTVLWKKLYHLYFGQPKFTTNEFELLLEYPLLKMLSLGTMTCFQLLFAGYGYIGKYCLELYLDRVEVFLEKFSMQEVAYGNGLGALKLLASIPVNYISPVLRKRLGWVYARLALQQNQSIVLSSISSDLWTSSEQRQFCGLELRSWESRGHFSCILDYLVLFLCNHQPSSADVAVFEELLNNVNIQNTESFTLFPRMEINITVPEGLRIEGFLDLWKAVITEYSSWLSTMAIILLSQSPLLRDILRFINTQDVLLLEKFVFDLLFQLKPRHEVLFSKCVTHLLEQCMKRQKSVSRDYVRFTLYFINECRRQRIKRWSCKPLEERRHEALFYFKLDLKVDPYLLMEASQYIGLNHSVLFIAETEVALEDSGASKQSVLPLKRPRSMTALDRVFELQNSSVLKNQLLKSMRALNSDDVSGPIPGMSLQEQFETFCFKKDYFNALTIWSNQDRSNNLSFDIGKIVQGSSLRLGSGTNDKARQVALGESLQWEDDSNDESRKLLEELNSMVNEEGDLTQVNNLLQRIVLAKFGSCLLEDMDKLKTFDFILKEVRTDREVFHYPLLSVFLAQICSKQEDSTPQERLLRFNLALSRKCLNESDVGYCREQLNVLQHLMKNSEMRQNHQELILEYRFVQAQYFWLIGEKSTAIYISDILIESLLSPEGANICDKAFVGEVICRTGKWQDELAQLPWQKIEEEYFKTAIKFIQGSTGDATRVLRDSYSAIAEYYDAMFYGVQQKVDTTIWKESIMHAEKVSSQVKRFIVPKDGQYDSAMRKKIKKRKANLGKQLELDQQHSDQVWANYGYFLKESVRFYARVLVVSSMRESEIRTLFRLFSLWFSHCHIDQEVNDIVAEFCIGDAGGVISASKFIPLLPQIFSRLGQNSDESNQFETIVLKLLLRIGDSYPFSLLTTIISFLVEDKPNNKGDPEDKQIRFERVKILHQSILRTNTTIEENSAVSYIETTLAAYRGFHMFARVKLKNKRLKPSILSFKDFPSFTSEMRKFNLAQVLMPASKIKLFSLDANAGLESICLLEPGFDFSHQKFAISLSGRSKPKIMKIKSHDGRLFKLLLKGGDDLRQDFIMEQLFSLVNNLLHSNYPTRKRDIKLRTYEVLPLSEDTGFIEWVTNTISFGEYLHGPLTGDFHSSAHYRFNNSTGTYSFVDCWRAMSEANKEDRNQNASRRKTSSSLQKQVMIYRRVCENFLPVFRHFFLETYSEPSVWYKRRQNFSRSVACNSMIGYIMGIGDRHTQNLLIDIRTAEIVHIDFGYVFEQSKLLSLPERVPFRLTPDIIDGFGITRERGSFQVGAEYVLHLLRNSAHVLNTICEVFIHDPLYDWKITPEARAETQVTTSSNFLVQDEATHDISLSRKRSMKMHSGEVDYEAKRALNKITQKLKGIEFGSGAVSDIPKQVRYLIRDATNEELLSRMFAGWAPFV